MMVVKYLAIVIIASSLVVVTPSVATQRYTESPTVSPAPSTAAGKVSAYTDSPAVSAAPSAATNKVSAYTDSPTVSPAPSTATNKVSLFGSAQDNNQDPKEDTGVSMFASNDYDANKVSMFASVQDNNQESKQITDSSIFGSNDYQEPAKTDDNEIDDDPLAPNALNTLALASSGYARSVNIIRTGVLVVTVALGCLFGSPF